MPTLKSYNSGVVCIHAKNVQVPGGAADTTFIADFSRLDFNESPPSANLHFTNFDNSGKELVISGLPRDVGVAFSAWHTSGKAAWAFYVKHVHFIDYYYSADYFRATFGP
jgi:hypothetical protein